MLYWIKRLRLLYWWISNETYENRKLGDIHKTRDQTGFITFSMNLYFPTWGNLKLSTLFVYRFARCLENKGFEVRTNWHANDAVLIQYKISDTNYVTNVRIAFCWLESEFLTQRRNKKLYTTLIVDSNSSVRSAIRRCNIRLIFMVRYPPTWRDADCITYMRFPMSIHKKEKSKKVVIRKIQLIYRYLVTNLLTSVSVKNSVHW